ncbi:MAG: substrate-binding domain-containing protein [Candidatus Omnitrophota bacterium]
MKRLMSCMTAIVMILGLFLSQADAKETIRLATTTSTYETGLLDYIFPPFEKKNDVQIHIISVGTGKAIKLGENGDVDIILVHARAAEDKFVDEGFGVNRRDVMYNDFVILSSPEDNAEISGLKDAKEALKRIYDTKQVFVSRGDDSGTHKKEKYLWSKTGLTPEPGWGWYLETGQGMSATLRVADEKGAYVMLDRATYIFNKDSIRLKIMVEGDKELFNPYGVIAINPYKHSHVKYELAMSLIGWLTSPECQERIEEYTKDGNRLYLPNANNPI